MSKFFKSGLSLARATSLFVLKAGDTMTGALINTFATPPQITIDTTASGANTARDQLISNIFTEFRGDVYTATASLAPALSGRRGRGTQSAPTVVATNDLLYTLNALGYGGTDFRSAGFFNFQCVDTTPSDTAMGCRWRLFVAPIGTIAPAETLRADAATGFSMFGANVVVDANRVYRNRLYTVGTLPAGVQGMRTVVTDALAPAFNAAVAAGGAVTIPVFYTGAAWNVG